YEMVSGIRPFTRPTATETQAAILRDDPPPLAPAGAPPELDRLIRRCLEKDGAARFQTARELALAIIGLLDNTAATTAKTPKRRMRPGHLVPVAVLIIVAGVVVYLLVRGPADRSPGPPAGPAPIDTVAVLPFAVEGQDPEAGYLGDDITFSLTERLGRYRDLKVRPYSSTSRFKDKPAAAAGRELGVRAVLVGMIQKRGEALQVRVELIDVGEDRLLWQKQYDGKADERLVLHRNIVQDIPDQLRFTLTGEQKRDLAKLPTQSTKAHELYVRGRLEWNKRTVEGLERAIRYFQDALASDPNYALAHSGLADCYVLAPGLGICTPGEGYRQAKDAALKALQLDPTLAEAYTSLAYLKATYAWDWAGAEADFRSALRLNPNYATARHWYSRYLTTMARHEEAIAEKRKAHELDPTSMVILSDLAFAMCFTDRDQEVEEVVQRVLKQDPKRTSAIYTLGNLRVRRGRYPEAIAILRPAFDQDRSYTLSGMDLAIAYAKSGKIPEARAVLQDLRDLAKRQHVPRHQFAAVLAGIGDTEQALTELEQAYAERDGGLAWLQVSHTWVELRQEPRFQALVKKMNFPPK
ncbi:MAG TPA: tetratricopeptide repeat protein, partial [Gemmataceae bacterium]|nr:tetratricopeptide repeat protein [Gemmataceae bacterium]